MKITNRLDKVLLIVMLFCVCMSSYASNSDSIVTPLYSSNFISCENAGMFYLAYIRTVDENFQPIPQEEQRLVIQKSGYGRQGKAESIVKEPIDIVQRQPIPIRMRAFDSRVFLLTDHFGENGLLNTAMYVFDKELNTFSRFLFPEFVASDVYVKNNSAYLLGVQNNKEGDNMVSIFKLNLGDSAVKVIAIYPSSNSFSMAYSGHPYSYEWNSTGIGYLRFYDYKAAVLREVNFYSENDSAAAVSFDADPYNGSENVRKFWSDNDTVLLLESAQPVDTAQLWVLKRFYKDRGNKKLVYLDAVTLASHFWHAETFTTDMHRGGNRFIITTGYGSEIFSRQGDYWLAAKEKGLYSIGYLQLFPYGEKEWLAAYLVSKDDRNYLVLKRVKSPENL